MWFKSRLNSWYIWIPSNPNLYSTKIIMKMWWQTIASNVSIRTISPTATPLPKAYDCVAVYIAGRRTSLVVYGWWPQPPTKKGKLIHSWWAACPNIYPQSHDITWWRHQMETFSALLAICVGNSPIPGQFPAQRPVTRSFGVFFDLRLNKRLGKQSWGRWFKKLSRPLWRHCNDTARIEVS